MVPFFACSNTYLRSFVQLRPEKTQTLPNKTNPWFINKKIFLTFHDAKFMLKSALAPIYNVLAHSKSVYCVEAWRNAPETHLKRAYITQKPMVRTNYYKISNF